MEIYNIGYLNTLFDTPENSYKVLTTEFLSTLTVEYNNREPTEMKFRLRNVECHLTVNELNGLFNFHERGIGTYYIPVDYNKNAFWNAITISEGEDAMFTPNRAKCNRMRNPTLRYMLKVIACIPFARVVSGPMQQDDLLILWTLLCGHHLNLGQYIARFLERQSRNSQEALRVEARRRARDTSTEDAILRQLNALQIECANAAAWRDQETAARQANWETYLKNREDDLRDSASIATSVRHVGIPISNIGKKM